MSGTSIEVRGVWKFYGDFPAVRGVSLEAPEGAILALLGRNGAGKTTVLRMLAGLMRPSRGVILLHGEESAAARTQIGMVGHGEWLYDDLTAQENLDFFARLYGVSEPRERILDWLEKTGLSRFRHSRAGEFSRGMRQRLAIARAFLHDPRILLLDEPWSSLDDRAIHLLSSLLLDARERGRTIVVCSHQLREALEVATHVAVIDRGRLRFSGGNREEFRSAPDRFYEQVS